MSRFDVRGPVVACIALIGAATLAGGQTPPSAPTPVPTHGSDGEAPIPAPQDGRTPAEATTAPATTSVAAATVDTSPEKDDAFAKALNLDALRSLSLQDRQTIKTWDTFARQAVAAITGKSSFEKREPLYTLLDMAFSPARYFERDVIRVKNVPLRQDFAGLPGLPAAEAQHILETGYVSLAFWVRPETQAYLQKIQQDAVWKSEAIGQVQNGAALLNAIMRDGPALTTMAFLAPPPGGEVWNTLPAVHGNVPLIADSLRAAGKPFERIDGYDDERLMQIFAAVAALQTAWADREASAAQVQIDRLATLLPALSPERYPSATKRHAEVWYNKLFKLTLPGAAIYFVAFVLFVMAAYSGGRGLRWWGVAFMVLGFALHTAGIGIRWWLDQKSTGSWFYSIPIKNQFESVMFSAWFGALVGILLEVWRKKSLFGAAAAFVGWLSLIAIFTVPYVFGKDIGNEIGRVNGILMSYWLYIHVTLAVASYALIGMSFLLGTWWLVRYLCLPREIREMNARQLSADAVEEDMKPESLALAFVPVPQLAGASLGQGQGHLSAPAGGAVGRVEASPQVEIARSALARLDACNVVILQLAFWILLVAIICGAIWADVSWGRPWGWDPKETFALVTWIVYLVIIHVRLVTKHKAFWTAILTIVGFFIMLFNWIGVNYFLVGLHSYA